MSVNAPDQHDPRYMAAIDLIGRTGAKGIQIRYSDDEQPIVWMAVADYREGHECAAALEPLRALLRLCDQLIDGATCVHCRRPSGITEDWEVQMPLDKVVCWYQYDPELAKFRRSCEGEAKVGRNDQCVCGSGKKFKNCHGSR